MARREGVVARLPVHRSRRRRLVPHVAGIRDQVSGRGRRALIQVDPARLVELAASSETVLAAMVRDWALALDDLSGACAALGDASGTTPLSASYADALATAGELVGALAEALGLGVAKLLDAAHDAVRADDAVVAELQLTAHQLSGGGLWRAPGPGGR